MKIEIQVPGFLVILNFFFVYALMSKQSLICEKVCQLSHLVFVVEKFLWPLPTYYY